MEEETAWVILELTLRTEDKVKFNQCSKFNTINFNTYIDFDIMDSVIK